MDVASGLMVLLLAVCCIVSLCVFAFLPEIQDALHLDPAARAQSTQMVTVACVLLLLVVGGCWLGLRVSPIAN